jgi:hypothetical protein
MDRAFGDHAPGFRRIGDHMRCGEMGLQRFEAFPLLDHNECISAKGRLKRTCVLDIGGRAIFDASFFGPDCREIGRDGGKQFFSHARLCRNYCDNVDNGHRWLSLN